MPHRQLSALRARLWPPRRYDEVGHGELEAHLEAHLEAIRASLDELLAGQAELRTRLRRNQALTARVYEKLADWPGHLSAARHTRRYALAYHERRPLISIPIPTFESPDTLCRRTLASVQAQSYTNWEAIVVGDHCRDDTEARVRALGDDRIRFHNLAVREPDPSDPWESWAVRGSIPRATGIELAAGAWIAPLSHDDAWDADHLSALLEAARERRLEVAYSRMRTIDAAAADEPDGATVGAWPPQIGQFAWQSSIFNGALQFLRYDRACALASEPNDWNLVRRAWDAGVRFGFVDRETSTLYRHPRGSEIRAALAARGLPPEAAAFP